MSAPVINRPVAKSPVTQRSANPAGEQSRPGVRPAPAAGRVPPASVLGRSGTVRRTPVMPVSTPRVSPTTRWLIGAAGVLAVLGATLLGWQFLKDPVRFPVSNVDVLGTLDYTDRAALQGKVAAFTDQGFYTLDIDALRDEVESLPWVAQAQIAREWPGRVEITVEEHEPAARWNDDSLVSKRLELFKPPQLSPDNVRHSEWQQVFATLPELRGADGRHSAVLDDFRRYSNALSLLDLDVQALVEDERLSQTVQLQNNLTLRLGYEEHERRMGRFITVFPRLADSLATDPVTFDMRYSDGFSVAGARSL